MKKISQKDVGDTQSLGQRFPVRDTDLIVIHEVFKTDHENSPFHASWELRASDGVLAGEGRFGCAIGYTDPIQIDFSRDETDAFLATLAKARMKPGPYSPRVTHTDDSPRIEMALHVRAEESATGGICLLFTRSQGEFHAPWGACLEDTVFTLPGKDIGAAVEDLIGGLRDQVLAGFRDDDFGRPAAKSEPAVEPEPAAEPKPDAQPSGGPRPDRDRFVGCLLGGAIGDALGYPVEFVASSKQIVKKHGAEPPERLAYAGPARISDDTQMTLFTAEGAIRGFQRFHDRGFADMSGCLARAYSRWYLTQLDGPPPDDQVIRNGWLIRERSLYARRHPGQTCLSAVSAEGFGSEGQGTVEHPPNQSKGCGAVMRSAPIGLAAREREVAFEWARDGAVLTHGHPSGYLAAAYFASVIFDVARSMSLVEAMLRADELLAREAGHEEVAAVIATVRTLAAAGAPIPGVVESVGEGWVAEEALGIALLCALTVAGSSPEDCSQALWRSVLHKGDSDSTGSLTGNLLGAMFGTGCLPDPWRNEVELSDLIQRIARDLHAVSVEEKVLDHADYPCI